MCSVRQLPREPNTLGRVQLRYRIHAFNEDLLGFIEDLQCVAEPSGHGGPVVRGAYMIFILVESMFYWEWRTVNEKTHGIAGTDWEGSRGGCDRGQRMNLRRA